MIAGLMIMGALLAVDAPSAPEHRGLVMSVELGGAAAFGATSAGVGPGVTAGGVVGYELAYGLTPIFGLEGTSFAASAGSTWEMSAMLGLRWYAGADRVRAWVEGAAGIGQFVYENNSRNGLIAAGPRLKAEGGVDAALASFVSVGLHLGFNDAYGSAGDYRWVDLGGAVTFTY